MDKNYINTSKIADVPTQVIEEFFLELEKQGFSSEIILNLRVEIANEKGLNYDVIKNIVLSENKIL